MLGRLNLNRCEFGTIFKGACISSAIYRGLSSFNINPIPISYYFLSNVNLLKSSQISSCDYIVFNTYDCTGSFYYYSFFQYWLFYSLSIFYTFNRGPIYVNEANPEKSAFEIFRSFSILLLISCSNLSSTLNIYFSLFNYIYLFYSEILSLVPFYSAIFISFNSLSILDF